MQQYLRVRSYFLVWLKIYQNVDPVSYGAYLVGSNYVPVPVIFTNVSVDIGSDMV